MGNICLYAKQDRYKIIYEHVQTTIHTYIQVKVYSTRMGLILIN